MMGKNAEKTEDQDKQYAGPSRLVAAGALGAVEAKIAAIASLAIGPAIGNWQHQRINEFLERNPTINDITEGSSGLFGKQFEEKIKTSKSGKAMLFSTVVASTALPIAGLIHGTWKGYHDANEGLEQFHRMKDKVESLQGEVDDLRIEKQSWQKRVKDNSQQAKDDLSTSR